MPVVKKSIVYEIGQDIISQLVTEYLEELFEVDAEAITNISAGIIKESPELEIQIRVMVHCNIAV